MHPGEASVVAQHVECETPPAGQWTRTTATLAIGEACHHAHRELGIELHAITAGLLLSRASSASAGASGTQRSPHSGSGMARESVSSRAHQIENGAPAAGLGRVGAEHRHAEHERLRLRALPPAALDACGSRPPSASTSSAVREPLAGVLEARAQRGPFAAIPRMPEHRDEGMIGARCVERAWYSATAVVHHEAGQRELRERVEERGECIGLYRRAKCDARPHARTRTRPELSACGVVHAGDDAPSLARSRRSRKVSPARRAGEIFSASSVETSKRTA